MNERGFFTIAGLCLAVIAAIFIKGIQEFEANYSRVVTNFRAEHELQNAADTALANAFNNFDNLPALDENKPQALPAETFTSENFGTITVEVRAQNTNVRRYIRKYTSANKYTDTADEESPREVTFVICVASCDNPFIKGKMYRRALAYRGDDGVIHYLSDAPK